MKLISGDNWTVYHGDCRVAMAQMAPSSVHMVVTSPPYWGSIRDYQIPPSVWGGDPVCDHQWADASTVNTRKNDDTAGPKQRSNPASVGHRVEKAASACSRCGAWLGCYGNEPKVEEYVAHTLEIFDGLRLVLRDDGVIFWNIGDTYADSTKWGGKTGGKHVKELHGQSIGRQRRDSGLFPGNKSLVPFRVAIAMQAAGWIVRQDNIWSKHPMPESVDGVRWVRCRVKVGKSLRSDVKKAEMTNGRPHGGYAADGKAFDSDAKWQPCPGCKKCEANGGYILRRGKWRPTTSHEYVLMVTKPGRYFCDAAAAAEQAIGSPPKQKTHRGATEYLNGDECHRTKGGLAEMDAVETRNPRSVWKISSEPYKGKHFACVDAATECLTARGWRLHQDLLLGEMIAAFDINTGLLSWKPLLDVSRYEVENEPLVRVSCRDASAVMTPNHRCIVQSRLPNRAEFGARRIVRADELKKLNVFTVAADWDASAATVIDDRLTPAWCELAGWYVAEGHECSGSTGVDIYQSQSANPDHVARIERLLRECEAEFKMARAKRKWKDRDVESVAFHVKGYAAVLLRELFPEKQIPAASLSWPTLCIDRFLDGLILGDGHTRADKRRWWSQKDKARVDMFHALCIRMGLTATVSPRPDGNGLAVFITHRKTRSYRGTGGYGQPFDTVLYSGIVWCPSVETGAWVARRDGRVFMTGNSYPTMLAWKCIQAATSKAGCCSACGAQYAPVVEKVRIPTRPGNDTKVGEYMVLDKDSPYQDHAGTICGNRDPQRHISVKRTLGYRPTCSCQAGEPVPAVVFDPFTGSGTTLQVSINTGRRFIGCEIAEHYLPLIQERAATPWVPKVPGKAKARKVEAAVEVEMPLFGDQL